MSFFKALRGQLIEVIEWTDNTSDTMVYRFPVQNNEIKMGAQLTVRESQVGIFVNEGQIADVFSPGRYRLSTENMPVLTKLKSWAYGFNSPFKAEVYFINTKQFTNQKWGTANPIMMRDHEFGMLRFRAFGIYAFKVADPVRFLRELFGTSSTFQTQDITSQLKKIITSGLADLVAESQIAALDLSMHYDELGDQCQFKLKPKFIEYGLDITSVVIENISLPKEVEEVLDKRTSMGILGDLNKYTQYQAAEALRDAAKNEGSGTIGAGMGLGAGAAFGNMMANSLHQAQQTQEKPPVPQPASPLSKSPAVTICHSCNHEVSEGFKFCGKCGTPVVKENPKCNQCQKEFSSDMKFCPECGNKLV